MRHRNLGLRKRCRCKRKDWPKCAHGWHMNYKPHRGSHCRISLDRELGQHVDSKTAAIEEAERIRIAIRNGTFRQSDTATPAAATFGDRHGLPRPEWVFPSSRGTALDESNVRKGFNAILDKAELHRRGPHQMRHSFASLLLQAGAPITYVSRQLGHRDSAITLTVYAHWLPDSTTQKAVDRLDDFTPAVAHPLHTTAEPALRKTA